MNQTEELLQRIKELEMENNSLREAVQEEKELNKKKNTLISQISHEIRTPLNVVISMAEIAKEELDNPNVVRDNLAEIANSSRILLGIVNNILDISALANGTLKIEENKFDLKDQITNLGIHFYEHAKYKKVHFDMHIKGVSEENLIGDEHILQQIMVNLFSNSLHFTPEGGKIDLSVIQASTSRNRVHMRFILQDSGNGLSEEMIHELFLSYEEKLSLASNNYTNTGISLFVTRQLIEMLGGSVRVESKQGEGSRFIVDIPFQKTKQREMDIDAVKRNRILIVADEEVAKERGDMLYDMGVPFEIVCDSYEALDLLGEAEKSGYPFSVCMIDMNRKDTYADALVVEIKKIFGKRPIIIATSHSSTEEKYKHLGADYTIANTLFRSTIFDALMNIEKGNITIEDSSSKYEYLKYYNFSRKRILVVEDIALNMEVLVKLLSKVKASVVCAEDGQEAVQTYLKKPVGYFDCILMDINMPVMDGYQATRAIRESKKEDAKTVPIFAMTANAFAEDITQALETGTNRQMMLDKFEEISKALLHPFDEIPGITLSAGAAFSDIGYTTELYRNADKALYQTKQNGRNGCTIYEEEIWTKQEEAVKKKYELKDYLNYSADGRVNMGDTISITGYRLMEYSMKTQLVNRYGSNQQKLIFREAGLQAGVYFVDRFLDKSLSLNQFILQLVEKMKEFKMGNLVLDRMDEKTGEAILTVFQDADCSGMTSIGETVCHYDEGFIAGVLSAYTNQKYTAIETHCWAKGDQFCQFVATPQSCA